MTPPGLFWTAWLLILLGTSAGVQASGVVETGRPLADIARRRPAAQDGEVKSKPTSGLRMQLEQAAQHQDDYGIFRRQAAGATPTPSSSSIPPSAPVGGITWLVPANTAAASFYKIAPGQSITFRWNYTSVISFGTSLTVQAYCSSNAVTYPLATLPARETALTWEPYAMEQSAGATKFAQATYTVHAFDERGPYAGLSPGLMSPFAGLQFAMYRPQDYTPLSSWTCASCSSASSFLADKSPIMIATFLTLAATLAGGWYGIIAGLQL